MADLATLRTQLTAAQSAYHDLMIGQAVVQIRDQNGELVIYNQADASKLATYISSLQRQIASLTGSTGPSGPMQVFM